MEIDNTNASPSNMATDKNFHVVGGVGIGGLYLDELTKDRSSRGL